MMSGVSAMLGTNCSILTKGRLISALYKHENPRKHIYYTTQAVKLFTEKGCVDEQALRAVQFNGEDFQWGCKVSFASCGAQTSTKHTEES